MGLNKPQKYIISRLYRLNYTDFVWSVKCEGINTQKSVYVYVTQFSEVFCIVYICRYRPIIVNCDNISFEWRWNSIIFIVLLIKSLISDDEYRGKYHFSPQRPRSYTGGLENGLSLKHQRRWLDLSST